MEKRMDFRIAVIGLGYVGLPLAVAFSKHFEHVVGLDTNQAHLDKLREGVDPLGEDLDDSLADSNITFTSDPGKLLECNFIIVSVPTPINEDKTPNLNALKLASESVANHLRKGDIVVYESTVYPGVTEEFCAPILEEISGLKAKEDFFLGYSPERINPGDARYSLAKVIKIVSGDSPETLEKVAGVYELVVEAGVYRAPSIKVAEAAKVIENAQRDLNIAFVNELAIVFDRLGLRTTDVLDAAGTKWNFLAFRPGLVGGHCIGVDPYYLTAKAQQVGYHPEVILAGRRINDDMGRFIARKLIKLLLYHNLGIKGNRIGIFGISFKENVADFRNSRVPDIVAELAEYGVNALVHDPLVDSDLVRHEYGIELVPKSSFNRLDALIVAVPHEELIKKIHEDMGSVVRPGGLIIDVKSVLDPEELKGRYVYWSL